MHCVCYLLHVGNHKDGRILRVYGDFGFYFGMDLGFYFWNATSALVGTVSWSFLKFLDF